MVFVENVNKRSIIVEWSDDIFCFF